MPGITLNPFARRIPDISEPCYDSDLSFSLFRWFCHFDDDNYVNVAALARLLAKYDPDKEWYLGKTSVSEPLQVMDREAKKVKRSIKFVLQNM